MNFLTKETEKLLQECIDNSSDFPQCLAKKFEGISADEAICLRECIKALVDNGYISKLQWADGVPWFGKITEKGYDYFHKREAFIQAKLKEAAGFPLLDSDASGLAAQIEQKSSPRLASKKAKKLGIASNKITFSGILGYDCGKVEPYSGPDRQMQDKGFVVYDGIPTLRGFAKISELAKASKAKYEEYQRTKNEDHVNEIAEFLETCKSEAKFLPEIILSVSSSEKAILKKYNYKSSSNISASIQGAIDNMNYYTLEVENGSLARVDGNHRLEAGKDKDYYVPFSIIVWAINPDDDENMLSTGTPSNNTESEAFLFYILNNTAKRLEAEENFKGLVNSESWTADELALINKQLPVLKHFERTYANSPLLDKSYLPAPLSQICEILTDIDNPDIGIEEFDTVFVDTMKLLGQADAFSYCREQFGDICFQLAFYTRYKSENLAESIKNLKLFNSWLEKYKYTGETFSKASKIFDVAYKFILSSPKTIFMAMEYKSEQIVADYNAALRRAAHTLNNMGGNIVVEPYTIMTGRGKSFSITADIYRKIEECAVFIADTTEANPNVMYELGIAYSKKKPIILVREKNKKKKVPSDIISDYYYSFDGMGELEKLFITHIKEILISDYGAVFPN